MLLVYDSDNVLHITNDKGLRWNYDKTQKPQFGFEYDNLFYNPFEEETNYILNDEEHPLNDESIQEIEEYIKLCDPPSQVTLQKQFMEDLNEEVDGRINRLFDIISDVGFNNTAQLVIASREMSNDPRRQIGRRVLDWVDFINGVNYRLKEEINATLEIDLKSYEHYLNELPSVPSNDTFYESNWADDRFDKNSDTLDIKGGQEDLAEDKRAV
tara:strand:- start:5856 stop:6494 length:639 start_codon:yes stop_codon:yes gene_type:complete